MKRTVSMTDLLALNPGETLEAETRDSRTPERFMRLAFDQTFQVAGNQGSIQVIKGAVELTFASGEQVVLSETGPNNGHLFHCRTPTDYRVRSTSDSWVQILGDYRPTHISTDNKNSPVRTNPRMVRTSEEAFYAIGNVYALGEVEMARLREEVGKTSRQRVRLCTHKNTNNELHEMFVCYTRTTGIQPHKHLAKDESFHVLEGELDFIMYNSTGDVLDIISMGDKHSGKPFYVRVPMDTYHSVAMTSDFCILHEGTAGPFSRDHTSWAKWS